MTDLAKELAIESNNWRHGKFFLVVHISKPVATATQQQQLMPPPPSPRKRPPTPDQIQHQQQQQQQQVEPDDKFFYVEHNPLVSATNVVLHTFTGQNNQQWLFENGGYIRNVQTDKVLDFSQQKLLCTDCNHSLGQKWCLENSAILSCLNTQFALDVQATQVSQIKNGSILCAKKKSQQSLVVTIELVPVSQQFQNHATSDMILNSFQKKENVTISNILFFLNRFGDKNLGIFNFLVNKLYEIENVDDIEFYLPQLLNIYLNKVSHSNSNLERLVLEKCSQSSNFGILLAWLLDGELGQEGMLPTVRERGAELRKAVEKATIDRVLPQRLLAQKTSCTSPVEETGDTKVVKLTFDYLLRQTFFTDITRAIHDLTDLSLRLKQYPVGTLRTERMKKELAEMNDHIPTGCYIPICKSSDNHERVLRIVANECIALSTKERVPMMVFAEVFINEFTAASPVLTEENIMILDKPVMMDKKKLERKMSHKRTQSFDVQGLQKASMAHSVSMVDFKMPFLTPLKPIKVKAETSEVVAQEHAHDHDFVVVDKEHEASAERKALLYAVYGESFEERKTRLKSTSPYALRSFIVKSNDDLRQERLAMQLILLFQQVFQEEKLPIQLMPYNITVTGPSSGLIETVVDTVSISSLKKKFPNYVSLLDYFKRVYGPETCSEFKKAQQNFIESLAGYSVVCYLLQIKDRHNGNILLHRQGQIVHIDFGFFLANSPGAIKFESAPFKMPMEYVDVMGGKDSDLFLYFKALVYQGLQASTKHYMRFVSLVELILPGLNFPCFMGNGLEVLRTFNQRFETEKDPIEYTKWVKSIVDESTDNWRTTYYDNFQKITNGIL